MKRMLIRVFGLAVALAATVALWWLLAGSPSYEPYDPPMKPAPDCHPHKGEVCTDM